MKRMIAMLTVIMTVFMMLPSVTWAATGSVTYTVAADKSVANPGDTVNFTVSIGAVTNLGGMDFYLEVPEGLTIDADSVKLVDGILDTLDANSMFISPESANDYYWSHFAGDNGYTGTTDLKLLSFSCTVDADATYTQKSVGLLVESCFDNDAELLNATVVPAKVTVEKVKIPVSGIALDKTSLTLKDGDTAVLTTTVSPEDADNKNVTWSSSNTEVATVNNGTVTAVKVGTAKITVTTEDGNKTAECTVTVTCNHTLTKTNAVAPTCAVNGNVEYYTCSKCNVKFSDAQATNVITNVVVAATGMHDPSDVRNEVEPTEDAEGYTGDVYCAVCEQLLTTGFVIPKLPHTHAMTKTDAVAPTCEQNGNVEYYTCSKCGKNYSDAAGTQELGTVVDLAKGHTEGTTWQKDADNHWKACTVCNKELNKAAHEFQWVVDSAATEDATGLKHEECACGAKQNENTEIPKLDHVHVGITYHEAVEPSCVAEGNVEYWTCSSNKCAGKYYGDAECQLELEAITLAIDPENHVYADDKDVECDGCGYVRYYEVTEGNDTVYDKKTSTGLVIKVEADLDKFDSLKVDGNLVAPEFYTLEEGSTIVTLKSTYLNTLAAGAHKITVEYTDGKVANVDFTVKANTSSKPSTNNNQSNLGNVPNPDNLPLTAPKTGEESAFPIGVLVVVLVAVLGTGAFMYKKSRAR